MRRLLFLSGGDPHILDRVPTERYKFVSLGASVLMSSFIAGVSMIYAFSELGISIVAALPIGVLWGLTIAAIERWVATSTPVQGRRRLTTALPRLVLSMAIGALTSIPIVLSIFRYEIQAELSSMKLPSSGLLAQLQALNELSSHDMTVNAARWLVLALFMLIEALPVATKLLQPSGLYEQILLVEAQEEVQSARIALRAQEASEIRTGVNWKYLLDDDIDNENGLDDILLRLGPPSSYRQPPYNLREDRGGIDT